jgi:hypothetical protein
MRYGAWYSYGPLRGLYDAGAAIVKSPIAMWNYLAKERAASRLRGAALREAQEKGARRRKEIEKEQEREEEIAWYSSGKKKKKGKKYTPKVQMEPTFGTPAWQYNPAEYTYQSSGAYPSLSEMHSW